MQKKIKTYYIPRPIIYQIQLRKDETGNFFMADKFLKGTFVKQFEAPVTTKSPKIYLVKHKDEIVYVGFTTDSISNRLRTGLAPGRYNKDDIDPSEGSHGYHGYKWKVLDKVDLYVWVFEGIELPKEKEKLDPIKQMFENIESEMVFQIKQQTGRWPKYQSEIHFYSQFDGHEPEKTMDNLGIAEEELAQNLLKTVI
ncbi:MAG: hypothetical protein U5Q03_10795 [Bacteroidota bacterium]|nr:hypothetical protein [Bacteroidota bacterium]